MRAIVLRVACNTCNSIVVHSQHPERARDTQNVFLTELEEEGWKLDNDSHQDMCPNCAADVARLAREIQEE